MTFSSFFSAALSFGQLALLPLAMLYGLWLFFLAVMNLQRSRDAGKLPRPAYLFGLPLLYAGLLLDFLCNMFPATLILLELPHEYVVTQRLQRLVAGPDGWRKRLALWFARNLLDPFDPKGYHVSPTDGPAADLT